MTTRRFTIDCVTAADGTGTFYSPFLSGALCAIHYIKPGSGGFANGADFAITAEATGETIWTESDVNASKSCYPRGPTHSNVGVAALYAASGTGVNDRIRLARDRVKIVLAQGGNALAGQFQLVVED